MNPKYTGLVKQQLEFIARHIPTTYFIAVVDVDGQWIAGWIKERDALYESDGAIEADRVSALSAATLSLGERVSSELRASVYKFAVLHGDKGIIFHLMLGDDYILSFGVREIQTIDITLVILQQWWDELLDLLNVPAPKL